MHKQAINHKQAIIGGGYLFTENACLILKLKISITTAIAASTGYYVCFELHYMYHAELLLINVVF